MNRQLTHEEIDKLEAGRELDGLIAAKVMDWRRIRLPALREPVFMPPEQWSNYTPEFQEAIEWDGFLPERVPRYSTDIAAAWKVVEKAGSFKVEFDVLIGDDEHWLCTYEVGGQNYRGRGNTAPLAICRAALKSVLVRDESKTERP